MSIAFKLYESTLIDHITPAIENTSEVKMHE